MVEGDGADGVEAAEVVFVRIVKTVPSDNIIRSVVLGGCEEVAVEFGEDGVGPCRVLFVGCDWGLEIASIGQAVGSDGPEFGKLEMALVQL